MTAMPAHDPVRPNPDPEPFPCTAELADTILATYDTALAMNTNTDRQRAHRDALAMVGAVAAGAGYNVALQEVIAALTAALTGRGMIPGQDMDPGLLDRELGAIAAAAEDTYRQVHDAMYTGDTTGLPSPGITLTQLLALLAGVRAALNMSATPTARDIVREDKTTPAVDPLRLHLVAAHGEFNALGAPDRIAQLLHEKAHQQADLLDSIHQMADGQPTGHDLADTSWSEEGCRRVLSEIGDPEVRADLETALAIVMERLDKAQAWLNNKSRPNAQDRGQGRG